jgi:hypothetical protein
MVDVLARNWGWVALRRAAMVSAVMACSYQCRLR